MEQLAAIVSDLEAASRRLHALATRLSPRDWLQRPGALQWSPAECIAHLNLSSAAVLPCLRQALREARAATEPVRSRYRLDAMGWLLTKLVTPGGGLKMTSPAAFVPEPCTTADCLVARFDALQRDLVQLARDADGLPIDRVCVVSPFDARVTCNLYAALTLVPRHQHRHLVQASRAVHAHVAVPLSLPA